MKYGIIFCAYNCASTVEKCLEPWKEIKNSQFVYSCVSVPFLQYKDSNILEDNTVELVHAANVMDYHITKPKFIQETEARGLCLQYLISQGCDIIIQVDGDELFILDNINNILDYVEKNPQAAWFKLSFKNYVFNENSYLEEPFTPARIYRVNHTPFRLGKFYNDNNIGYIYGYGDGLTSEQLPFSDGVVKNKIIPKEIAWIKHITWLNNETSKNKINYQKSRGWNCSYAWDEEKGLIFNPEFYIGKSLPKLIKE